MALAGEGGVGRRANQLIKARLGSNLDLSPNFVKQLPCDTCLRWLLFLLGGGELVLVLTIFFLYF